MISGQNLVVMMVTSLASLTSLTSLTILTSFTSLLTSLLVRGGEALTEQQILQVRTWAPLIYHHTQENFYPSSVEAFLQNVQLRKVGGEVASTDVTRENLPTGNASSAFHLQTKKDLNCPDCFPPFLRGSPPDLVPVYAFATGYADACATLDITYSTFYPFNYGKGLCLGLVKFGFCIGQWKTLGNHVADWEQLSIRVQRGLPVQAYLSVHDVGALYRYDRQTGSFQLQQGDSFHYNSNRISLEVFVTYPQELTIQDGRLVVYSANGSHGLWAQPGEHTYFQFLHVKLDDVTNRGQPWKTWENLEIIDTKKSFTDAKSWINFQGRWGNIQSKGCSECNVVPSPYGPFKYLKPGFGKFSVPPDCPN